MIDYFDDNSTNRIVLAHRAQEDIICNFLENNECYSVDLSRRRTLKTLKIKYIHTLDLGACFNLTDISHLGNVHSLKLNVCIGIDNASLYYLKNVHTLDLSYCRIYDARYLRHAHTLILNMTHVQDVSMLGNVHTLDLSNTPVADVSMLGNVHTLNLSGCINVTDVSML